MPDPLQGAAPEAENTEAEEAVSPDVEPQFSEELALPPKHGRVRRGSTFGVISLIVVGLIMFAIGTATGYLGRPLVERTPDPHAAFLALVKSKTRHFKGNPSAPVTIIEFSDYQ